MVEEKKLSHVLIWWRFFCFKEEAGRKDVRESLECIASRKMRMKRSAKGRVIGCPKRQNSGLADLNFFLSLNTCFLGHFSQVNWRVFCTLNGSKKWTDGKTKSVLHESNGYFVVLDLLVNRLSFYTRILHFSKLSDDGPKSHTLS